MNKTEQGQHVCRTACNRNRLTGRATIRQKRSIGYAGSGDVLPAALSQPVESVGKAALDED